ncbi:MAG: DNA polymerase/3'-5' exonuclease PolX [Chloroflexi bacterium]|nr:DNA polymerase/3'-5' exonuclease PolX [Chloroflexota bacterium]MBV9897974.1 DNA polymerase/3'-5' exonuclease PolX [Chloroflexota bacterium]
MKNREVAAALRELADSMELLGEDRYRVANYRDAATRVEHHHEPIEVMAEEHRVEQLHGIGKSIGAKIVEYLETGTLAAIEERRPRVPQAALRLMQIPGVGPKRAMQFAQELNVQTIADLQAALDSGQIAALPRLGEKIAEALRIELQRLDARSQRLPLAIALPAAEEVMRQLRACAEVQSVAVAGSIRRWRETTGDIDILVASSDPTVVMEAFTRLPVVKQVLGAGDTRASIVTVADVQIDLRVVAPESIGVALQYFTGSKEHNVKLRALAVRRGLKVNEYGVFPADDDSRNLGSRSEEEVYAALGLPWIPPELREGAGEIEMARRGALPVLVSESDLRGDLHTHTRLTDGSSTIAEMVRAGLERGYAYLAITDHSQALGITGGLTDDELRAEHAQIRELQPEYPTMQLLCGVEVDIHIDERLDCSDEFLESCDVVVASIHSALQKPRSVQTSRLISAIRNPHVDVIAHPTGRLLGRRPGYEIDLAAVLDACASHGVAIEVSGQPSRLDLDADGIRAALERGVKLVLNTDSHAADQIGELMRYAVGTARRGGATAESIINTRDFAGLQRWLRREHT